MSQWPKLVNVYTDGASRGNPGAASIGIHILDEHGETVLEHGEVLGIETNNVAEYTAVLRALEICHEHKVETLNLFSDSELLIKQLNGEYKVKSPNLIDLYFACMSQTKNFKKISFSHVRREKNKIADKLANLALDRNQ